MELLGNCAQECLEVRSVVDECCRGCLKTPFRVRGNCGGERAKLFIQLVLKRLHGFVEVVFGKKWVGICSVPIAWIFSAMTSLTGA